MIPYGHQHIDQKDIKAVIRVLNSKWLTQGPEVNKFEKALAKYCGAQYAVATSHGTAALHLAYLVAGLSAGDEVITTPNTFVATTNMLLTVGAQPVFCDIRIDTYNIDENKIENLITKKTKAVAPVHFAGQPCEMDKIKKIAKKYKLLVIEDACHALGARYKNSRIGSCKYSDLAVFSFHPIKPITTGEGGAILTNSKRYYQKLISLRNHGIHKDKQGKNVMTALGYNYRITDIQSALGISQLKKLDKFIKNRHLIVTWYEAELRAIKKLILPQEVAGNYSGWHLYVIRVRDSKIRNKLMLYLKKRGIGVNFHYPAIYSHPYYEHFNYKKDLLKNEKEYEKSCLTLPLYPQLKKQQVKYISNIIKNFFIEKIK